MIECHDGAPFKTKWLHKYGLLLTIASNVLKDFVYGLFQKFRTCHLKDRKLILYVKGKDQLIKAEIIKERDKCFMCLIQVMICDKKLAFTGQFYTVPDLTCKNAAI